MDNTQYLLVNYSLLILRKLLALDPSRPNFDARLHIIIIIMYKLLLHILLRNIVINIVNTS